MADIFIPIILATGREERRSEHAAQFVFEQVKNVESVEAELVDVRDYVGEGGVTVPAWVESKRFEPWRESAQRADAFIIVTPEYNHGYPGELKLLLDSAYDEYARKPVGLCGVSSGGFGGARALQALKLTLVELGLVIPKTHVYFSNAKELFDEKGNIADDSYGEKVSKMTDELLWYARALKTAREDD